MEIRSKLLFEIEGKSRYFKNIVFNHLVFNNNIARQGIIADSSEQVRLHFVCQVSERRTQLTIKCLAIYVYSSTG
jgi:hypothetical protein